MQIYLAKPGCEKKGPFSIEQINRDPQLAKPGAKCRFIDDLRSHWITRLKQSDYQELGIGACRN